MAALSPVTRAVHEVDRTICLHVFAFASDQLQSVRTTTGSVPPPAVDLPVDQTGAELKRGALLNTIALLASNFMGVFGFLVARLLGPAALGMFSVAWAITDVISKVAVFGLDNAITTFIARSEAVGDRSRSRALFRVAVGIVLVQSAAIALLSITVIRLFGHQLGLERNMVSALALVLCALPGVGLYRVCISVSRGAKVMQHDIYSRGITEPIVTILAFLIALATGFDNFSPEVAAIVGTAASALIAFTLASRLFRAHPESSSISYRSEARQLLGYAAPISAHQLITAFISRLDVITLGFFIGHAPGVTLTTVGVYAAVVEIANGLRKVNQAFNPIFAPIVAGMTATGAHERAAAAYARLAQWMLWILLPAVAVMVLAGGTILLIFGPAFRQGGVWLGIVAFASATNAFLSLGETVIMVQRPRLNLMHSLITCAVALGALLWLIPRYGVIGAAFGILLPYVAQGVLRYTALRFVFHWKEPWSEIAPPIVAAIIALVPAVVCRALLPGILGQLTSGAAFLLVFGGAWLRFRSNSKN
jgi:O-antigen/teichoic acid export membrane protein